MPKNVSRFFVYVFLTLGTFTSVFKDTLSIESETTILHKQFFFVYMIEGFGTVQIITDTGNGNITDSDPKQ
jgi:hypothetical protein